MDQHPLSDLCGEGRPLDQGRLRPAARIDLGDVVPADLSGQAGPDFDLVDPRDLWIDAEYQRDLSPKSRKLILRIVAGWCWSKFKPPICARVDGRLHVLDGQHTSLAAISHGGIPIIPIVVVTAPEIIDRARAFVSHATDRVPATPGQIWRAAATAGDEDALTIRNLCMRASVELLPFAPDRSAYKPRQTVALATIRQVLARRGAETAVEVMRAASDAEFAPIAADHLKMADALLCGEDYRGEFDVEAVTALLRGLSPTIYTEARGLAISKHLPMWRALTAVLYRNRKGKPKPVAGIPAAAPAPVVRPARTPEPTPKPHTVMARTVTPEHRVVVDLPGLPPPGRSALDARRAGA